ncbi:Fur family transcriptional regulator [Acidihalobacter ferrooxydans]|uniref:Ferric uptake regulation protein n=1 Tax=Acidihalobacter ferrooxydans TaxID=1765967 RepID=A0A1P8UJV5_9GAMM|nr:Fur family transcriptional regulator [Acidihalobacter ferrooxydans]APZ44110.1 transcriptional repressor [Acidihalobacter ferrooxydans]
MQADEQTQFAAADRIIAMLREHSITPTQPRVLIGGLLFRGPQHFSADQVLAGLGAAGREVSRATVYNTLGLFAERGLLREVVVDPSRLFYDTNVDPHHHIFHTDTGVLEDIATDQVGLTAFPMLPAHLRMEGVDIIIRVSDRMNSPESGASLPTMD